MKQQLKTSLVILVTTTFLSACGGHSGGGGVVIIPPANKVVSVSGIASQSSGPTGVSASSVTKQTAAAVLAGAGVTIFSYDTNGTLKETVTAVTGPSGAFNAQVTALGGGGTVSVKVQTPNAITYEKSFPYATASELSGGLQVAAVLDPVAVKVIEVSKPEIGFDKAAIGDNMVSIALVNNARGVKSIVSNSQITAAKSAGGTVTWQLDVAKSVLAAAGTQTLTVKAQNYNPASPDDMTRFPADRTDTGERLISASFDFVDIKDQDGKALTITKNAAKAARKSAAVAYAVRKQIPDCSLILKDENSTKAGVQVGFYFMRNGTWQKLGESTLYDSVGSPTADPVLHTLGACTSSGRPYAVLTDADVSKDIDFDLKWFNFDYIAVGDLKTDCVEGAFNLKKTDGTSTGLGGVNMNLYGLKQGSSSVAGFQNAYGYTKSDGKFKFDFTYQSVALSGPTATISYTDPTSWQQGSKNVTLSTKNANGCYEVSPIEIVEPACSVSGKLLKSNGTAAVGRSLNTYQTSSYSGNRWTMTDSTGAYSIPVMCNLDYALNADGMAKAFNVNATVGPDESADNGTQATIKDITKVNNAPSAYIYADNSSVAVNNSVNLNGYGYDPDYDSLTYAWSTTCGTFLDPGAATASATSTQQTTKWTAPATVPVTNMCTLTLVVNDGSKTGTTTSDMYVSSSGNRPPVISYLYAPTAITVGRSADLLVQAYDANSGDVLSYSWTSSCGSLAGATTARPNFTASQTTGPCEVTVQISDDKAATSSKTATILVNPNQAPVINATVPSVVAQGGTVTLVGSGYDINGDNLTWSWAIVSGGGTLNSATCSGTGSGSVAANCGFTAPSAEGNVTLRFSVSDGSNPAVTSDKTLLVSSASGVTVITVQ